MTIAKTDARKQYAGDGVTTAFSFPYRFFDDSDLQVYILDASNVETLQTLTTDYTVANNGDETGGTVTMITAPASGETLTILRAIPQTQSTDYQANDAFPAETHEAALDRITLLVQQQEEQLSRAIVAPASDSELTELPVDRASSYLYFDDSKNPIAVAGGVSEVAVSAFMATVLDDVDATSARATLGAGTLDDIVSDETPQLGGDLDTNGNNIAFDDLSDIRDDSGNEYLVFEKTASAINQVHLGNAATGNGPTIRADGDDANTDLNVTPKGTGRVKVTNPNLIVGSDADGDIYYRASGNTARLAKGSADQVLTMNAGATAPEWADAQVGWRQIGTNEPTTDVSEVAFTGISGNGYRSARLHGILQIKSGVAANVDVRASGGTWRTIGKTAVGVSNQALFFDFTVHNLDGAAGADLVYCTGVSHSGPAAIDRSANVAVTSTGSDAVFGYSSHSEVIDEIRIQSGANFEGSTADQRGVVILEAI